MTRNFIYKCKKCKKALCLKAPTNIQHERMEAFKDMGLDPATTERNLQGYSMCPFCRAKWAFLGHWIQGRITGTPCDHRCTGATGHRCECSCGGENHGIDNRITLELPPIVITN